MRYRNLAEILPRHAQERASQVAVRFKRNERYQDLTWTGYRDQVFACAAALVESGIKPGDRVGLLGENRIEWQVADLAILTAGAVTVSPHCTLSARQVHFQMHDADVKSLFVSTAGQLEKVRQVRGELPALQGVVVFDGAAAGADAVSWDEFLARGREKFGLVEPKIAKRIRELGPDDLATIMYTSGTTGDPKGVMLTHGNLVSNVESCLEAEPPRLDDVKLCWLPLSHIYARTVDHYERLFAGMVICLAENPETVVANIAEIQPTHLSCVPRFYEKLLSVVASPDPKVTAAKLKGVFGPRIRFLGSGGAPLPLAIEQTLRAAGLPVLPGYGLTESSPVITFNRTSHYREGTVGPALPS
jgi:long-chain acyl-CoA synthetase